VESTLVVGLVIKPHGVFGEVVVEPSSDDPRRFEPGSHLLAGEKELVVTASRPKGARKLVRFEGIDDRTSAEVLRGAWLLVSATGSAKLPEGSYWRHELIGFSVKTRTGRILGELRDVQDNPAHDLWVVRDESGNEILIPAVRHLILSVDRDDSVITVRELPGLTVPDDA
jgi:16S rRNA processing protein RimM